MTRRFIYFVIVGGLAAIVNWLSRIVVSYFTIIEIAIVIAFLIGMTTAFLLNRIYVFADSGRKVQDEYLRFVFVNFVALIQVMIVTIGLYRYAFPAIDFYWHADEVAHGIGVVSPLFTSYLLHKYFTFSKI